jgi:hypothetical protein
MIARVNAGSFPGEPVYLTAEEFKKKFTRKTGSREFCTNEEAVWWSKNGRLGSRWQVNVDMYIMVSKGGEDPFKYYTPPEDPAQLGSPYWASSSKSDGSCSSGSCGGGCKC